MKFFLTAITASAFLIGCDKESEKEDQCIMYEIAPVLKVTGANNILTNQETNLNVVYALAGNCGNFNGVDTIINGNTTIVQVKAKNIGCVCTDNIVTGQTTFKFKAAQPGVYYIKFLQYNNRYLTDTITVN